MTELVTLKFRRGTTSEWTATSSKLAAGEPGFDITTGDLKIGNGNSSWIDLQSFKPREAIQGERGATGTTGLSAFAWNPARTGSGAEGRYIKGEIVFYQDRYYICNVMNDAIPPMGSSVSGIYWSPYSFTGATGTNGERGTTGATGITLSGFEDATILLSDGAGGVTGFPEFSFNTDTGININAKVDTNRLVMTGYGGSYFSDDYGDSWNPCTGTIPVYAAACSDSGVWIGANGTQVLSSSNGITWTQRFALAGESGNDNKYGIAFNGNACVVGTVTGNVAFCPNVTATPQVWSSPSVQLTDVNISGVVWNSTMNTWWLFGSSNSSATIYTFNGINTPTPLPLEDSVGDPIPALFTDATNLDAWCMCGIQAGTSNIWIVGGKGADQSSSLVRLVPTDSDVTAWAPTYDSSVTTGKNYVRCLATDGKYIYGGHTGLGIIRSSILPLASNAWTNYSTVYASWIDLTYIGGYWFAGVGSPYNVGRSVMWSETGVRWDSLYVGPGITTAYTVRASPGLISGVSTVLSTKFNPKRVGILTDNPYTTLDVRGSIASYTQYMNVGASDNGLNLIKNNVADPVGVIAAGEGYRSAAAFSLDIPSSNIATIDIVGTLKLTFPDGGTYGVLQVDDLGQLLFTSFSPEGTIVVGPVIMVSSKKEVGDTYATEY